MLRTIVLAVAVTGASAALSVDLESADSIRAAAKLVAGNLMAYYHGEEPGNIPGVLPGPPPAGAYYWWEGGALWGTMVDYWHYTHDQAYNDVTERALLFQANYPHNDYMPPNWTASLGNDDQGFWGMSAMLAAETTFKNPPPDQPQWLALAQAVFNTQASRWDDRYCNGGLRWQIPLSNNGYNYKNSIANAIFFNLGARLARYTNNKTYAEWATKTWDWMEGVGYIDPANYNVYDGGHVEENCTDINRAQFSYTAAIFIQGCGFLYNYTNGEQHWRERLEGLTNRTLTNFFPPSYESGRAAAVEPSCELEEKNQCTTDMLSFKGYVHRWMAQTTQLAPFTHDIIMPILKQSTQSMAESCLPDGTCGFRWNRGSYDGDTGAGQQMNALGALVSLLVDQPEVKGAVTAKHGGTSSGDPNAGENAEGEEWEGESTLITNGDRVGAGIVTFFLVGSVVGMMVWVSMTTGEEAEYSRASRGMKAKGKATVRERT
ncbi:putative mannan endo-1,6-alpha-mannosidase precursor [Triangularia verruculosa]|uniref:Mannan endo-1,6-alpha-mannosidase n=1 Tax=Triangularia verruculosa TaxID=2587418 RepID=A0AAN6XSX6_9PEZI|nr:putative mannan endo-1,6-alpha-mannosidase precursor [Triangularia verruculosa]